MNKDQQKLLFKALSSYLPYQLKIMNHYVGEEYTYEHDAISTLGIHWSDDKMEIINVLDHGFKPVLHPLSRLTEEIEHNGERFVPFDELQKNEFWCDAFSEWWDQQYPDYERMMVSCPRVIFEHLLEWHFDIYSLIPKGMAIEKQLS